MLLPLHVLLIVCTQRRLEARLDHVQSINLSLLSQYLLPTVFPGHLFIQLLQELHVASCAIMSEIRKLEGHRRRISVGYFCLALLDGKPLKVRHT